VFHQALQEGSDVLSLLVVLGDGDSGSLRNGGVVLLLGLADDDLVTILQTVLTAAAVTAAGTAALAALAGGLGGSLGHQDGLLNDLLLGHGSLDGLSLDLRLRLCLFCSFFLLFFRFSLILHVQDIRYH
jgi:hypothetical protein